MTIEPVDNVTRPAAVDAQTRKAAEGFEQLLVSQLARTMLDGALGDEGAAAGVYGALLPDALAQAVVDGGGLGISDALARSLVERSS